MQKKQKKYYAVRTGKQTGVFSTRTECEAVVKGFPGAKYKGFPSLEQAQRALSNDYESFLSDKPSTDIMAEDIPFERKSIAVDAACSGNPGVMEYRGVDLETGAEIFREKFNLGTNNIGEFLAIIHGLSRIKEKNPSKIAIYSDSRIAINRVRQKKCTTQLIENAETKKLYTLIARGILWLEKNNYDIDIIKRDTKNRGEIPADFGRK